MKRHLLTMLLVGLCALTASAHNFVSGSIYYNITDYSDLEVEVTYRGDSPDAYSDEYLGMVIIPSTVSYEGDTYRVTSIGYDAFQGCSNLTAITIPEGVTSIGDYAFYECSSLESITLPEDVTSIGERAFYNCSRLTAINIPEGVTSIEDYTFYGCSSLTAVHISSLEAWCNIDFEGSYANPLNYAKNLYLNGELVTELAIPNSVTAIKDYAFYGCSSLTAVHISSLEAWCNIDFGGFSANPLSYAKNLYLNGELVTELTIPNSVTAIKNYAFSGCSSLESINILEGVTSIGDYTFSGCSNLTDITLPEGVTSIGERAFYNCSRLTAINIPESVTSIGEYTFHKCSNLTAVHISSLEAWCNIDFAHPSANPLYYAKNLYLNGGLVTELTIPNSVTAIKNYAFYGWSSLKSITLPEGVTSIGFYAFHECSSLTAITLPEGVTSIGSMAFEDCSRLTDITLPEGVTSIGGGAFCGCSSLTAINIPEGVTSIGDYTFDGCSSLTAINIPEGVTSIGWYAFEGCSSLTAITIPEDVTSIGRKAFDGCSSLTDIYCYAESVPAIDDNVFSNYNATLYVPQSAMASYQRATAWNNFTIKKLMVPGYQVTDLSDLSNDKVYTLRSARAFLLHSEAEEVADKLCSNTGSSVGAVEYALGNPALHFRIEKQGDNYYLYSVGAEQYVDADGYYEAQANTVLKIENVGGDYPWKLFLGDHGMNSQVQGQTDEGIQVDGWTSTDEGNCYQIFEVATPIITLNRYVATLTETKMMTLIATVRPYVIAVTWSSSNPSVATVDAATGLVTAVTPGTATITAKAGSKEATCVVTVEPEPEGLLTGKNYRVKNVTTGLYLQVEGNNTNMKLQNKAEGVALMQVFQLEEAAEGMYYLKAADSDNNYYAHASGWNFNATTNADNKTPFTIGLVEGETEVYSLHQGVSTYTGLAGADAAEAGAVIYCNKSVDNNGKWAFEPLTEEENAAYVTTLTATAKAALDAAIARGEEVVATRSAVLTAEEVAAINDAVQTAKEGKDAATEVAALKALSDAIHTAVDAAIYVWSIDELSNEVCYAVSTEDRGAWYAQAANLTSTAKAGVAVDATDKKQQFAFVQSPETGALYLYSVSEEKFVKAEGGYTTLTEASAQTITILDGTRSAAFPWVVALNAEDGQKQMGISNGYDPAVITHWNDLGDGGNTVRIEKAATFDATAALAAIKALETGVEKTAVNGGQTTVIYDLTGRCVEKATKGIYIVNGKKVVIK